MTHPPLKLFLLRAGEHFWHPPTCPVTPHLFYRAQDHLFAAVAIFGARRWITPNAIT